MNNFVSRKFADIHIQLSINKKSASNLGFEMFHRFYMNVVAHILRFTNSAYVMTLIVILNHIDTDTVITGLLAIAMQSDY